MASEAAIRSRRARSARRSGVVLALVCAAAFMGVLDIAIVNVALPSIESDLGLSEKSIQWIVIAYGLVCGGFLLLGGRLADLLGRRRIFVTGRRSSRSPRWLPAWPHRWPWTREDIKTLREQARDRSISTTEIAKNLGRTVNAVRTEAQRKNISLKPKTR